MSRHLSRAFGAIFAILCNFCVHCSLSDGVRERYLEDYSRRYTLVPGDILLAGLFSIHRYNSSSFCGVDVFNPAVYHAMAIEFAVYAINRNPHILPYCSLGYVIFDECQKNDIALARILHLLPDKGLPLSSLLSANLTNYPFYDVVGLVGPATSSSAALVSKALGFYQIPQVSFFATSDALSDKVQYPYFMRTVAVDLHQTKTIAELLQRFNWTYVSGVYQGDYGASGLLSLERAIGLLGGCFAMKLEITKSTTHAEYREIVSKLLGNGNARVVVLYAKVSQAKRFFHAFLEMHAEEHLVVVASDGLGGTTLDEPTSVQELPEGLLVINPYMNAIAQFDEYFLSKTGADARWDMVLHDFWQEKFGCSFAVGTCHETDHFTAKNGFYTDTSVSLITDAVYTYAYAIDKIVRQKCPGLRGSRVRDCIKGDELLNAMKAISFRGHSGDVSYDKNGNMRAVYEVRNVRLNAEGLKIAVRVASLDLSNLTLAAEIDNFHWHPAFVDKGESGHPISVCSLPCGIGQQRVNIENTCCWKCRDCRPSEIVVANQSQCLQCPNLEWPDKLRTNCEPILAEYMNWTSGLCIALAAATIVGIVICTTLTCLFVRFREKQLIKASGRELMYIILIGSYVTLSCIFLLLIRPNDVICTSYYILFSLSFTLIYAPMLTKTRRIYVIFAGGKKSKRAPTAISQTSQLIIVAVLIGVQVSCETLINGLRRLFETLINGLRHLFGAMIL